MEQQSGSHRPPAGREDWWCEDATETLVEAWGARYLKLNRGNLRQKDWKEVAEEVNSRHGSGRPKTDVQCKNRIDTLKKKYKTEKAKSSPSKWPFFQRLDSLIGPVLKKPRAGAAKSAPLNPDRNPSGSKSTDSSLDEEEEEEEEEEHEDDDEGEEWGFVARKQRRVEEVDRSEGGECRELARAILKLGEIYERIESAKQQTMIELEKQRMEMTKEIELQRINMLMEMQLELEKSKHKKYHAGSGKLHSTG